MYMTIFSRYGDFGVLKRSFFGLLKLASALECGLLKVT